MNFKQNIDYVIEEIIEDVVDMNIDTDDIREITKYCHENGITTESEFTENCHEGGFLGDWIDNLRDEVTEFIGEHVIYYSDGIDILNSTDTWSGWDYYFDNYGTADNVAALGAMVLLAEFEENYGYDALIEELYSYIGDEEEEDDYDDLN